MIEYVAWLQRLRAHRESTAVLAVAQKFGSVGEDELVDLDELAERTELDPLLHADEDEDDQD